MMPLGQAERLQVNSLHSIFAVGKMLKYLHMTIHEIFVKSFKIIHVFILAFFGGSTHI